jgi:hypothetical protein
MSDFDINSVELAVSATTGLAERNRITIKMEQTKSRLIGWIREIEAGPLIKWVERHKENEECHICTHHVD